VPRRAVDDSAEVAAVDAFPFATRKNLGRQAAALGTEETRSATVELRARGGAGLSPIAYAQSRGSADKFRRERRAPRLAFWKQAVVRPIAAEYLPRSQNKGAVNPDALQNVPAQYATIKRRSAAQQ
jgi:hypothetical protein